MEESESKLDIWCTDGCNITVANIEFEKVVGFAHDNFGCEINSKDNTFNYNNGVVVVHYQ